MLAVIGFLECRPSKTDQTIALGQGFAAAVDGVALDSIAEQLGVFIRVGAVQPFQAVHHPGDVAHAGNDFGFGEQIADRRQARTPLPVGVEHHRFVSLVGVVGIEQSAQQAPAHVGVDHRAEFAAGAALLKDTGKQRADRAGHAGMKARVLQKNRRKQGGT